MPVADSDPIRAALTEAIAEAMYDAKWPQHEQRIPYRLQLTRQDAERALSVVESWTPTKPCPECGGPDHAWIDDGVKGYPCPNCDGTGLVASDVPGIIELLMEEISSKISATVFGVTAHAAPTGFYRLRERPVL